MDKIILLGIDGVPFELMKDLAKKEIMPNFKEFCILNVPSINLVKTMNNTYTLGFISLDLRKRLYSI
ncbi:MAG: hypothetical protein ACTSPW_09260 [Promethearchaeota archaeon]